LNYYTDLCPWGRDTGRSAAWLSGGQDYRIGTPPELTSVLLIQWTQMLFRYGSLSQWCGNILNCWCQWHAIGIPRM